MRLATVTVIGLSAAVFAFSACDKKAEDAKPAEKVPVADKAAKGETVKGEAKAADPMKGHDMAAKKEAPAGGEATPNPAGGAAAGEQGKALLGAYEKVRVALAKDDWEATKAAAKTLGDWAQAHAGKMDAAFKADLEGIAAGAAKMTAAADIEASRGEAFGNVSKHTIAVVVTAKDLGEGVQVYRCPMAKAYKKWLQLDADMANPYMGKRMLKCGGKVKTEV